ncbi:Acyl-CoA:lysophosphatidylglycerol acyltransferase 1 [Bulinus truncatus]|nr:Acyl-CoA:lysophosphatidylglycerol acyltransferase 1 [Bulinus truncatus]
MRVSSRRLLILLNVMFVVLNSLILYKLQAIIEMATITTYVSYVARFTFFVLSNLYSLPCYLVWMILLTPVRILIPDLYWKIEAFMFRMLQSMVVTWMEISGFKVKECGDDIGVLHDKAAILLVNHQSTADTPVIMLSTYNKKMASGNMLWIIYILFKYTNFGLVSCLRGDFFIDQGKDVRQLQLVKLKEHLTNVYLPRNKKWLLVFPEGGFLYKRLTSSQEYARKHGFPVLQHSTLPRIGAIKTILDTVGVPPKNEKQDTNYQLADQSHQLSWVIDMTIAYKDRQALDMLGMVVGYNPRKDVLVHYRAYPAQDIPRDEAGLTTWLYDVYAKKDAMLDYYYKEGRLPDEVLNAPSELPQLPLAYLKFDLLEQLLIHDSEQSPCLFHSCRKCGVESMVAEYGVESMVCRIWCGEYGVQKMVLRVWCAEYDVESMVWRIWRVEEITAKTVTWVDQFVGYIPLHPLHTQHGCLEIPKEEPFYFYRLFDKVFLSLQKAIAMAKFATLVSTNWLREQILCSARGLPKLTNSLRVLDTSWLPDPDVDGYKQFYQEAHIPTALHFDLKKVSPPVPGSKVKFQIPDTNVFQDYVENLGISNFTHVVAYDRFNTRPSFRTWFLFRLFGHEKISVLNGGLRQWIMNGFHVTTEEPSVEKGEFKVNFRPNLLRDYDAMAKNVKVQKEQVMDARDSDSFYISDKDDSGGHIPGAINIPFSSLFNEDGTVKSKSDLKKLFENAGIDLSKPLVSSCQTGMTACGLIAAASILGRDDVPLYNGSFTEWSAVSDPSLIVRKKKNEN